MSFKPNLRKTTITRFPIEEPKEEAPVMDIDVEKVNGVWVSRKPKAKPKYPCDQVNINKYYHNEDENYPIALVDKKGPYGICFEEANRTKAIYISYRDLGCNDSIMYIPDSVEKIIFDRYPASDYGLAPCRLTITPEMLSGMNHSNFDIIDGAVYSKDHSHLFGFFNLPNKIRLHENLKTISPFAFNNLLYEDKEITFPAGITQVDLQYSNYETWQKMGIREPHIQLVFEGKVTEINVPVGIKCRTNNYIENVNVIGRDKNYDRDLVFKTPDPDMSAVNGRTITLTEAGAERIGDKGVSYSRQHARAIPWSNPYTLNAQFVAAVSPVELDCYDRTSGTKILLCCNRCLINRNEKPEYAIGYIDVYENYQLVMQKLEAAGWS